MNENINLVEILKDCPKGTKLYSILFGEVEFEGVHGGSRTVGYTTRTGRRFDVTREGKMFENYDGECTIFPSKDQRDWSKFDASCLKKERDKDKLIQELGEYKVKYTQEVLEKYINSMSNKDDERLRKTTITFLKDFAEQGYENAIECIDWLKKQSESSQTNERAWLYLVSDVLTWKDGIGQYLDDPRVQELAKRLCSEYAQKLYNPSVLSNSSNIRKNEQKFDPKTLQPYDKVIARLHQGIWCCELFSFIEKNTNLIKCCGAYYAQCVPYNDETKHLIGTTNEAPEYYRYWCD